MRIQTHNDNRDATPYISSRAVLVSLGLPAGTTTSARPAAAAAGVAVAAAALLVLTVARWQQLEAPAERIADAFLCGMHSRISPSPPAVAGSASGASAGAMAPEAPAADAAFAITNPLGAGSSGLEKEGF